MGKKLAQTIDKMGVEGWRVINYLKGSTNSQWSANPKRGKKIGR